MRKRSTDDVLREVEHEMLNNVTFHPHSNHYANTYNYYNSNPPPGGSDSYVNCQLPPEAVGWPPGLVQYVHRVVLSAARVIMDNVSDWDEFRKELDEEMNKIILNGGTNNEGNP